MKTAEDFNKAAAERNITRWNIHNCAICGTPIGFNIWGNYVEFDNDCDCTAGFGRPTDWQEIADTYNLNAGAANVQERMAQYPDFKKFVETTNTFWGFDQ